MFQLPYDMMVSDGSHHACHFVEIEQRVYCLPHVDVGALVEIRDQKYEVIRRTSVPLPTMHFMYDLKRITYSFEDRLASRIQAKIDEEAAEERRLILSDDYDPVKYGTKYLDRREAYLEVLKMLRG